MCFWGVRNTVLGLSTPRCPRAYVQVVDEGLAGLGEGGAVLAVLHHVEPVGFPEVGELPAVPQRLPQRAVPRQGHPAEQRSWSLCRGHHEGPSATRMQVCPAFPVAMLPSQVTTQQGI